MEFVLKNKTDKEIFIAMKMTEQLFRRNDKGFFFYQIILFERADLNITIDGFKTAVRAGDVCFIYPSQKVIMEGHFSGMAILFHPNFFCIDIHAKDVGCQGLLFNNFLNDCLLKCNDGDFNILKNIYNQIIEEIIGTQIGKMDMMRSYLKIFLVNAVRIKKQTITDDQKSKSLLGRQIEELIEQHFLAENRLVFYADKLSVSTATFNRYCHKYFQQSFVNIINLKKIALAKKKLYLTNNSVKEIAYNVGYNDPMYFSRVFKKNCGVSPREFREQLREN